MDLKIPKALSGKRIVVMDDQGSMRSVFQAYLREMGFREIATLGDGLEGIKHLESQAADLIICDWNMPKKSGLEVLQAVRSCEDTRDLPFLMVTSSSELSRVKEAAQSGVSDYLIKPFQPRQLGQKVTSLLTGSKYQPKKLKLQRLSLQDGQKPSTDNDEDDFGLMVDTVLNSDKPQ